MRQLAKFQIYSVTLHTIHLRNEASIRRLLTIHELPLVVLIPADELSDFSC